MFQHLEKRERDLASLTNTVPLPKLTKAVNYENSSLRMNAFLSSHENWKVIENGFEEPTYIMNWLNSQLKAFKEARVKDKTSLYILYQPIWCVRLRSQRTYRCSLLKSLSCLLRRLSNGRRRRWHSHLINYSK